MGSRAAACTGIALVFIWATVLLPARQPLQEPASETAAFEVASVKPNTSRVSNAVPASRANGSYSASNVALKSVIANAYEVRIFQIEGGPDWLTSERFDIIARGREGTPDRLRPAMLRTLLAERFKLAAHFETREQQVYALVLARSDGRLGLQLKPSPPSASGATPGPVMTSVDNGVARIQGSRVPLDNFALVLASSVFSRRVIDRTGLGGQFDLDLRFTPESSPAVAPEFPSIFTAVQEQLGLRLQSERGPVPVLVIDSVQRPTPD
jgi:uncharacterized protein (TIGR03435 family)